MKLGLNELKIGPRLALGYGVTVALLVLVVAVTIGRLEHVNQDNQRLLDLQRRAALAEEWRAQVYLNDVRAQALAKSGGDRETLDFFAPQVALTAQRITALQRQLSGMVDSVKGKALIAEIDTHRHAYTDARATLLELLRAGKAVDARRLLEERLQPISLQYLTDIETLAEYQQQRITDGTAVIARDVRSAEWTAALLAAMAVAVAAFFAWRISNSVSAPIRRCIEVADCIARGDLTQPIPQLGHDEMNELLQSLTRMQGALGGLVGGVRGSSDLIATVSTRIASGNQALSSRNEQTAAHLQQAAHSLAQITSGLEQTAGSARTATELADNASAEALRGGNVVAKVVSTMGDIRESSHRIADIIGTIDGIAFQTNILALNAAVEAARAGPQGLGFAVVAGEVRSLAQRSAAAAREIKGLIGASVEKVESGAQLVQQAGSTMDDIVGSVQRVTQVINQISSATAEQTGGLRQINEAVAHLDQMTQQNTSLVEEGSQASRSLAAQSGELAGVVSGFRVGSGRRF